MHAAAAKSLIVGSQTVYADSLTTDALGTTFPMSSGVDALRGAHRSGEVKVRLQLLPPQLDVIQLFQGHPIPGIVGGGKVISFPPDTSLCSV